MSLLNNSYQKSKQNYFSSVSNYLKTIKLENVNLNIKKNRLLHYNPDYYMLGNSLRKEIENVYIPIGVWITGAPLLWLQGYKGDGVTVGVIDTGIDPSHSDLLNVGKRVSFIGDNDYTDFHFHGTHVAGIIGAKGRIRGVAPNVILNDYRVFDKNGNTNEEAVHKAIICAVNDGCDIINMSLGSSFSIDSIKQSIDYAINNDVLVVVAAGNESSEAKWDESIVSYPANYPSVISVASIEYDYYNGEIKTSNTKFSNRNPEVDVCANGYKVFSCIPNKNGKERYGCLSGTSMACSHVSGFSALILSKLKYLSGNTHKQKLDLYSMVKSLTVPISINNLKGINEVNNNITGAGLVTIFPEIPTLWKESEKIYYLKNMNMFAPIIDWK